MNKYIYMNIAIITFIITVVCFLSYSLLFSGSAENFDGSHFNIISGYFPQSVVSDKIDTATNLEDCLSTCDKDPKCTGFLMSGKNCWNIKTKSNAIPAFIKAKDPKVFNPISGIKQLADCNSAQQTFGGTCSGNDYPTNDLLPIPSYVHADTFGNCVEKCIDNDGCVGISYDTVKQNCYLKKKMSGNGNPALHRLSWIRSTA